ncbi:MAG TPA: glycosyltransferase family A protein [Solirubrobacteraceae bacterium]|nr:glycosyltransferase family A protein [Solirubrobacteraceae bacterium]
MSADGDITALEAPIAVVIPCHDDGATLEQAVESARGQDVPVEVIVVDDGSTDPGTLTALDRLAAAEVRVLRQENRGPGPARMTGLQSTRAEYVLPLDADDRLLPGALRILLGELDGNPSVVAAWGSARHFGGLEFVQNSLPTLDPWQLSYQNHLPLSALYRRDAVLAAGGWRLAGGYEDWDLWMALAEAGLKGVGVSAVTGEYRVEAGRRLSRSSRRHAERCAALRKRHPRLYADRRRHRRESPAPVALKVALPVIDALPLSADRKRLLAGGACYLAYGSGWPTIAARLRAHRIRRAR